MMELLRELGPFHYMMNQGNVGDALIAASTVALFEREGLEFSSCGPELPAGKEEITLVYGGGGGFVPYFGMLPHYVRLFSDPHLRRCVILPQSFRDCDELVDVLDERFTVFCRERASYDYCLSRNGKARFMLADDMALAAEPEMLKKRPVRLPFLEMEERAWGKCMKKDTKTSLVTLPGAGKLAVCLRSDPESTGHAQSLKELPLNTDLSAYSVRVIDEVEHAFAYARWLLKALDQPDVILTDRLHLGISGALLGKEVFLMDNVYGKISGIYELSLRERFPRVHLLNELSEFPWLDKVLAAPDMDRCREKKAAHARRTGKAAALFKYLYYRKEENGMLRIKVCGLRVYKKRLGHPPVGKTGTPSF
ncbi:polysaccharide pyruvyl transferase family protein [Akkermansia muciniphila]|uniref:polysaccharide pyruvyl transferase family protein n=1 Tax=Akkermansia muciniphila TaxID=239935 RepID=UPI0015E14E20|nr:polysaccharide pyruvyl transferase family protein [Akkermansia muciniphila]